MYLMEEQKKLPVWKTALGTAMWAKVNTVIDDYKGQRKYSIKFELPEKDEKELISRIEKLYKEYQELPENEGKEWRHKPRLGFKPDKKTGKIQFTFSTNAFYKDKNTGEDTQRTVMVKNKFGQDISEESIGNGSKIKIGFMPRPYHENEDQNGVKLYLREIVVFDLVKFGGQSSVFEDEFISYEPEDDEENIPI
jgi:hypothetical protein